MDSFNYYQRNHRPNVKRVSSALKLHKLNQLQPSLSNLADKHPLQRLTSPSRQLSALVHLLGLASFSYSFHYLAANPNHINTAFGWHFQYLTIIGLTLATTTFALGFLADLTLSPKIFRYKNILSMCSCPMEILITFLYFGLRSIDPTLVVPKGMDIPILADLSFHFAPSALLLIDLLFLSPPWTITALPAIGLSGIIAFAYWFWIELCFMRNGFYPYPIFGVLDNTRRMALFAGSALIMAGVTSALKWTYAKVNGFPDGYPMARPGDVNREKISGSI